MNNLLIQALLAGVESGLRHVLAADPLALQKLGQLEGRVIAIEATAPAAVIYLLPAADGLHLAAHHEGAIDCTLRAPLHLLAKLAVTQRKTEVLHAPEAELRGDSGTLMQLATLLQSLELDWEYALSKWLGPVATGIIGQVFRGQTQQITRGRDNLHEAVADFLTEESRAMVGRREAEARFAELDRMTLALDRLDARIARLARPRQEPQERP